MNSRAKIFLIASALSILSASGGLIFASVDDAQSFALEAAAPYVKEGFQVREDYWGGDLGSGEKKAVRQQLFKGNEYWFWMGNWRSNRTAGRKAISPPRTSFRKRPEVISSSWRSRNRRKNARTGRSFTVSADLSCRAQSRHLLLVD